MTKSPDPSAPRSALDDLRERARSLDANEADIDALLRAMRRPLAPGEEARPRVDTLHLIIEDPALGGLRGSSGHRVDASALRALLALGEPYASELSATGQRVLAQLPPPPRPPAVREVARQARAGAVKSSSETGTSESWGHLVGGVAIGWGLLELLSMSMVLSSWSSGLGVLAMVFPLAVSGLTLVGPGLRIYTRSSGVGSRVLYITLNVLMIPGMMLLGLVSALFGGSQQMNANIAAFMTMMGLGVVVRILVTLRLLMKG